MTWPVGAEKFQSRYESIDPLERNSRCFAPVGFLPSAGESPPHMPVRGFSLQITTTRRSCEQPPGTPPPERRPERYCRNVSSSPPQTQWTSRPSAPLASARCLPIADRPWPATTRTLQACQSPPTTEGHALSPAPLAIPPVLAR